MKLKHTIYTYCICLLAGIFSVSNLLAQRLSATLDREKILLGEQVSLELRLDDVNPRTSSVKDWFVVPDTANHIEFLQRSAIDTVDINGSNTFVQRITFTSFDSGRWQLPPLSVSVIDKNTGAASVFTRSDLFIDVLPVDVAQLKDYHEMKDIAQVQVKNYTWIIVVAVIIGLVLLWLLWRFVLKKLFARKPKKIMPVSKATALQMALQQLAELKASLPATDAAVKQWFIQLDDICRSYVAQTLQPKALQQTSDELMVSLKSLLAKEQLRTEFYQLLRLNDAVKFAKYLPAQQQQTEAVNKATDIVKQIDQTLGTQATAHVNGVV